MQNIYTVYIKILYNSHQILSNMRYFNFNKNTIDFRWILIPLICFVYVCCGTK